MKSTYYFPHDYHARHDLKLQMLTMEEVGIYWCLIEMLYEEKGYIKLKLCERIANALHTQCDKVKTVIENFDLFEIDSETFWSNSVLRRLKEIEEKSDKAKQSANLRWSMRSHSDGNAINKIKGNKKKENNIDIYQKNLDFFNNQEETIKDLAGKNGNEPLIRQEIARFVDYWTEPTRTGKQRWELQKTFEIKRRLKTWFSNLNKFK